MYPKAIFEFPATLYGEQPLVDIRGHIRVYVQIERLDAYLIHKAVYLALELFRKQDARLYLSCTEARRTRLLHIDIHRRAHALARYLH